MVNAVSKKTSARDQHQHNLQRKKILPTYKKTIITEDNKYNEQSEPQTAKTVWLRPFHIAKHHISEHQSSFTFLNE